LFNKNSKYSKYSKYSKDSKSSQFFMWCLVLHKKNPHEKHSLNYAFMWPKNTRKKQIIHPVCFNFFNVRKFLKLQLP